MNRYILRSIVQHGSRRVLIRASTAIATLGVGCAAYSLSRKAQIHLDIDERPNTFSQKLLNEQNTPPLSLDDSERKLRGLEHIVEVNHGGISRYDVTTVGRYVHGMCIHM
jgi:hypothetical protein